MNNFNDFIKNNLNTHQQKAVKKKSGAILVTAGAGSGKTRVITSRIANLILNQKQDPKSIIALTFTNKAAGEMRERINNFLQEKHVSPFVGTFHSYCLLLLRKNSDLLPFQNFSILDADDQKSLIKKILKQHGLEKEFSPAQIQYQISKLKNKLGANTENEIYLPKIIKEIYTAYETEKTMAHSLDFDDLLLQILRIFSEDEKFKKKHQETIKHILVDEYQDTNSVQHELLKQMALNKNKFVIKTLCAVGDEDQSIYSWRGAQVENILNFQHDFKPVTKIKIEQNYRSVQPILNIANKVIAHNKMRNPKNLWSEKKAKNRIMCLNCKSNYQEADVIACFLENQSSQKNLNDIAILYRTHFQSRFLEESLIQSNIPYKIIGGIRFYERKEIKDIIAYLKLIANPFDRTSFFRIINIPTRGLGQKFEDLIYTKWNQNPF